MSRNIARFFHLSLEIEFNALRFINYTIPRLCSTYVVATIDIEQLADSDHLETMISQKPSRDTKWAGRGAKGKATSKAQAGSQLCDTLELKKNPVEVSQSKH